MKRKNVAIILAGGMGARSGLTIPKQFLKIAGKTVLEHSVDAFQKSPDIDEIAIVAAPEYHEKISELCGGAAKLKKILVGGKERYHSTLSAIKAYENEEGINLIIHDAVRPLVSGRIIRDCGEALRHSPAVSTAIPSADTIVETDGKAVVNIPPRSRFWRAQTPQCFYLEILKKSYEKALADPKFETTDDCKIVRTYCPEVNIILVQGDESNIKLTYAEDIYLIERLFQLRCENIDPTQSRF